MRPTSLPSDVVIGQLGRSWAIMNLLMSSIDT